ncbi:MAG: Rieske 2Fe-2S domain-containing protein [Meiothermus sp.]|nr:Rieske 2Fe-2S domain-containing protein [Meiothermus sp.]
MSEPIDRRKTLQVIAASSIGLATSTQPAIAQQKPVPIRIAALQGVLAKEWDTLEYTFEGTPALLLRIPKPAEGDRRALVVRRGSETLFLVSYLLVCTHQGCKPALPNPERNLVCPCHGSTYKATDGSVVRGPARQMLEGIRLEVRNGVIFAVGLLS